MLSSQAGLGPQELPELVASDPTFKQLDASNASIFGHSMGGNGAPACLLQTAACYESKNPSGGYTFMTKLTVQCCCLAIRALYASIVGRCPDDCPQEPGCVQVCIRFCTHRQPHHIQPGAERWTC